ncbi:MAG: hypothetical protein SR3Q1_07465 [Quinella sp. 3Q1]|nr:hypothetical protein [Quinella sp. 3Q1]MBR6888578.1 hypothetical protein [Selenomonadaceae bacterium]
MKKFLAALIVLILFAATVSAESMPVRIARLPIIFQSTIPDAETCAGLETKIERAIHIPLNGTLQLAEYLPPKDSAQTLNDLWQDMRAENKKAKLADAMRPLAQKLDADIIVCPILKQYSQYTSMSSGWHGETILTCQVRVELIVYDRRTDELIDKKASQMYHDSYSLRGTASYLAGICFDSVIEDSQLHQRIMAIR